MIPLKEQSLDANNYQLTYNSNLELLILILSNHILLFSVKEKVLKFQGEAQGKKPYFITNILTRGKYLFFTAIDQHNIYSIDLEDSLRAHTITNYNKYKLPLEVNITVISSTKRKLLGICQDGHLRVWNI